MFCSRCLWQRLESFVQSLTISIYKKWRGFILGLFIQQKPKIAGQLRCLLCLWQVTRARSIPNPLEQCYKPSQNISRILRSHCDIVKYIFSFIFSLSTVNYVNDEKVGYPCSIWRNQQKSNIYIYMYISIYIYWMSSYSPTQPSSLSQTETDGITPCCVHTNGTWKRKETDS